jgi:hypothetical protein
MGIMRVCQMDVLFTTDLGQLKCSSKVQLAPHGEFDSFNPNISKRLSERRTRLDRGNLAKAHTRKPMTQGKHLRLSPAPCPLRINMQNVI